MRSIGREHMCLIKLKIDRDTKFGNQTAKLMDLIKVVIKQSLNN